MIGAVVTRGFGGQGVHYVPVTGYLRPASVVQLIVGSTIVLRDSNPSTIIPQGPVRR